MTVTPTSPLEEILTRLAESRADEDAWTALYRQTWPYVFAVAFRRLRGIRELAEDVGQEVYLRLARSCPFEKLQNPDAFRGYLWRVTDNVARTHLQRVLKRQQTESEQPIDLVEPEVSPEVEREVEANELIRNMFRELEGRDRELLRLVLEGRGLSDIVQATGVSYANAGVRVHRLRRRLRKYLMTQGLTGKLDEL